MLGLILNLIIVIGICYFLARTWGLRHVMTTFLGLMKKVWIGAPVKVKDSDSKTREE